jgi:hypothetical protein
LFAPPLRGEDLEASNRALKLWTLEAPQLEAPMKNLINGASGTVTIPCPSYLVQHERGACPVRHEHHAAGRGRSGGRVR